MNIKSWRDLSEIQKEDIAKNFYSKDKPERRSLIRHLDGCNCEYKDFPYYLICYQNFYEKFLSEFNTKIDLNNFDEAVDAAQHLPILVFNLIQFCTNLDRAKKLMRISKKVYKHLPEKYRNTKEIYEMAIYSYRGSMLRFMPKHLKNDTKFAAKAIRQNVDALRFFNKKVRSSKTIEKILLKSNIENVKCRSSVYLLPEKMQKKIVWLKPHMLFFADLLNKTNIDCPRIAFYTLMSDSWVHDILEYTDENDNVIETKKRISKIWHADKIITNKNLKKFGPKFFAIYLIKYLEQHQHEWAHLLDEDYLRSSKPIITEQNLIIPAILESVSKKVASKALSAKIKYRIKFYLSNNPFSQLALSQKIKDLQKDESYLVNKVANAAVELFENITESNTSIEVEVPGIWKAQKAYIDPLNFKYNNPYLQRGRVPDIPF